MSPLTSFHSRLFAPALLAGLLAAGCASSPAAIESPAPFSRETISRIEELMPGLMLGLNVPGVSVALVLDGRIAWREEYGGRRAGHAEPVVEASTMEACSMSKPLFAYAVMGLVEEGRLDLDRPLVEYLEQPYLPDEPLHRKITARMVLTHTSGFPNWREGGWRGGGPLPVFFAPGTRFQYSGEGFLYLQRVVEAITGVPLEPWMQERVLLPLGMEDSGFVWREEQSAQASAGHDDGGAWKEDRPLYTEANAAFSLYTTASDYARFQIEMMSPDRSAAHSISAEALERMLAAHSYREEEEADWGLGWGLQSTPYGLRVFHGGSNGTGFRCWNELYPRHGQGIAIMTNAPGGRALCRKLMEQLRE